MLQDPNLSSLLIVAVYITFGSLVLSFIFASYRLIKGPTIPDRVVAIELITNILMAIIIVFLIQSGESIFIDAVGTLALIAFLSAIAYAQHLESEIKHD